MKKMLLFLLFACMGLFSCQVDEPVPQRETDPGVTGSTTRSTQPYLYQREVIKLNVRLRNFETGVPHAYHIRIYNEADEVVYERSETLTSGHSAEVPLMEVGLYRAEASLDGISLDPVIFYLPVTPDPYPVWELLVTKWNDTAGTADLLIRDNGNVSEITPSLAKLNVKLKNNASVTSTFTTRIYTSSLMKVYETTQILPGGIWSQTLELQVGKYYAETLINGVQTDFYSFELQVPESQVMIWNLLSTHGFDGTKTIELEDHGNRMDSTINKTYLKIGLQNDDPNVIKKYVVRVYKRNSTLVHRKTMWVLPGSYWSEVLEMPEGDYFAESIADGQWIAPLWFNMGPATGNLPVKEYRTTVGENGAKTTTLEDCTPVPSETLYHRRRELTVYENSELAPDYIQSKWDIQVDISNDPGFPGTSHTWEKEYPYRIKRVQRQYHINEPDTPRIEHILSQTEGIIHAGTHIKTLNIGSKTATRRGVGITVIDYEFELVN